MTQCPLRERGLVCDWNGTRKMSLFGHTTPSFTVSWELQDLGYHQNKTMSKPAPRPKDTHYPPHGQTSMLGHTSPCWDKALTQTSELAHISKDLHGQNQFPLCLQTSSSANRRQGSLQTWVSRKSFWDIADQSLEDFNLFIFTSGRNCNSLCLMSRHEVLEA